MAKVISVFSPKGGVGKTFIATNLAVSISKKLRHGRILLVDLDLQLLGDISKLLNLKPVKSIVELIPIWKNTGSLEMSEINDYVYKHNTTGIDFMPLILNLKQRPDIDGGFISFVLSEMSKVYDYIIIDAGHAFTKAAFGVFENSNLILFVANPDVLSVSQVKEGMEVLQSFAFPLKMVRVVLNRAESLGGVSIAEVKSALPCEIIAKIPSDGKSVCLALNRRIPLVLDSPQSRVTMHFEKLAEDLMQREDYYIAHRDLEGMIGHAFTGDNANKYTNISEESVLVQKDQDTQAVARRLTKDDKVSLLKQKIHQKLLEDLELYRMDVVANDAVKLKELREKVRKTVSNILANETGSLIGISEREQFIKDITDEAVGLGPLEDLLNDPDITDIMVNNSNQIFIEKKGKITLTEKKFSSNAQVRQVIERIVAPLGRRIDESVPMVDGRLANGSRVNAIIPPLALTGPTLTIRKFSGGKLSIFDLVKIGSLTEDMANFIKYSVLTRRNVIVSGGTGSGKTTVLNVLSEFIPDGERIVTIEDAAELKLHHVHCVRLESRPQNIEGKGSITIRDLFRNSLRMRPDRIIIGECRGLETLDMLQAMNTGHDGSMTTIHANSTQDVLSRMDSLILMSGVEIPVRAIREMIASAVNIIVHTARLSDGSRKVLQISEVIGMIDEFHIKMNDIFNFKQTGTAEDGKIQGFYTATGEIPTFYDEIKRRGFAISEAMFKPKTE